MSGPPRPTVTLKLATSLDGRIALANGASRWITGPESRAEVHRMRAGHDAVLTGIGTVRADDPQLTARIDPAPARQPLRVVLDSTARCPLDAALLRADPARAPLVITGQGRAAPAAVAGLAAAGFVVAGVPVEPGSGRIDLLQALWLLARDHGVARVMIEAGAGIAGAALRAGVVDRVVWFRAPLLLGADARPVSDALGYGQLADVPRWRLVQVERIGADLMETWDLP